MDLFTALVLSPPAPVSAARCGPHRTCSPPPWEPCPPPWPPPRPWRTGWRQTSHRTWRGHTVKGDTAGRGIFTFLIEDPNTCSNVLQYWHRCSSFIFTLFREGTFIKYGSYNIKCSCTCAQRSSLICTFTNVLIDSGHLLQKLRITVSKLENPICRGWDGHSCTC